MTPTHPLTVTCLTETVFFPPPPSALIAIMYALDVAFAA
jgi:hypothetical protein